MRKIVISLLIAIATNSYAQTDQVCTDLAKFSCAPGVYDDGTGSANTPASSVDQEKAFLEKNHARTKQKFKEAFEDVSNGALRRGILSASGLSVREDCEGADDAPEGECLELMAEYGAGMVTAGSMPLRQGPQSQGMSGDLDDRMFVLELDSFQSIRKEVIAELRDELKADALDVKFKAYVKTIKSLLIKKVKSHVSDPVAQKIMLDRIKDAKPGGSHCMDHTTAGLPEVMIPNMFYNPTTRQASYCFGNRIRNTSDFNLAFFIAHELSHSIDPCNIQRGPKDFSFRYSAKTVPEAEREYPLPGLIPCLRQPTSIQAARQMAPPSASGMRTAQWPYSPPPIQGQPLKSNGAEPFTSFCSPVDQAVEASADWWAAEVMPEFIAQTHKDLNQKQIRTGYSNVARSYCNEEEMRDQRGTIATHPTNRRRLDFLLLMQPKVRAQMGCPEDLPEGRVYCSGEAAQQPAQFAPPDGYPQYPYYQPQMPQSPYSPGTKK